MHWHWRSINDFTLPFFLEKYGGMLDTANDYGIPVYMVSDRTFNKTKVVIALPIDRALLTSVANAQSTLSYLKRNHIIIPPNDLKTGYRISEEVFATIKPKLKDWMCGTVFFDTADEEEEALLNLAR